MNSQIKKRLFYVGGLSAAGLLVGIVYLIILISSAEDRMEELGNQQEGQEISLKVASSDSYDYDGEETEKSPSRRRHSGPKETPGNTIIGKRSKEIIAGHTVPTLENSERGKISQSPKPPRINAKELSISSQFVEDPLLKQQKVQRDVEHGKLFLSRKRRFLDESKASFVKPPSTALVALQTSFKELLEELEKAVNEDASFQDQDINKSTVLNDFLERYFKSVLDEVIGKYNALFKGACGESDIKAFKMLFETWRKWLSTLGINSDLSKAKYEWLAFTELSKAEIWCNAQPKVPKTTKTIAEGNELFAGELRVVFQGGSELLITKPTNFITRTTKEFNYAVTKGGPRIQSVEFLSGKYPISVEDALKGALIFEMDLQGAKISLDVYEDVEKMPLPHSQFKTSVWKLEATDLPQYKGFITLRFKNMQVHIPEHERIVRPIGRSTSFSKDIRMIEKFEL